MRSSACLGDTKVGLTERLGHDADAWGQRNVFRAEVVAAALTRDNDQVGAFDEQVARMLVSE